ncbi:heterocyst-inhibiting protein PatX [Calothrix sp. UHCC 0171]|uniref:heterocyst-inhibiting protein PatX n=1 Tax=Calothrix sp. UHCC 0171 TaxID=3110245 RepID=UPI002B1FC502|nr:hypothetical protein [Calothrix sp. UHCC 0171]MEA5573094.1 hypothetical protein [Calothrix sp. UHCC 0171]
MRVAISLLITTVFFGSLTVNDHNLLQSSSTNQQEIASISKSGKKTKKPQQPIPHRGSGRRDLREYSVFSSADV